MCVCCSINVNNIYLFTFVTWLRAKPHPQTRSLLQSLSPAYSSSLASILLLSLCLIESPLKMDPWPWPAYSWVGANKGFDVGGWVGGWRERGAVWQSESKKRISFPCITMPLRHRNWKDVNPGAGFYLYFIWFCQRFPFIPRWLKSIQEANYASHCEP